MKFFSVGVVKSFIVLTVILSSLTDVGLAQPQTEKKLEYRRSGKLLLSAVGLIAGSSSLAGVGATTSPEIALDSEAAVLPSISESAVSYGNSTLEKLFEDSSDDEFNFKHKT